MDKGTIIIAMFFTIQGAAIIWLAVSSFLQESRIAQTEIDSEFLRRMVDVLVRELDKLEKKTKENNETNL